MDVYDAVHRRERLACVKDGLFHIFSTGGDEAPLEYRVGGVKALFIASLRVNVRVGNGFHSYYDSLDLYSARNRSAFAQAIYKTMGTEVSAVERDLIAILEYLEKERDEALLQHTRRERRELTMAEREEGLELLEDPNLCARIVDDMSALGYVGDETNKLLLYLCASSRKTDDPMSVLIVSQSASGKSYLINAVRRLMPEEEVVAVTSLSDQALHYADNLVHKFLILGEAVHSGVVEYQIREMLSGKELSRLVTVRDPETARLSSRLVRIPVIVASVMGSTNYNVNPENASRCFVIHADESREQTARIHESQRKKYSLERIRGGDAAVERIIRGHRAAQLLLQKRNIVNDFARFLDFPVGGVRTRRDHDRFLDLIAGVCFLRQYQKKEEQEEGLPFIRCDLEDYRIAYGLTVNAILPHTMDDLPQGTHILYDDIRRRLRNEALDNGVRITDISFTQRQVRETTGLGHTWVKANIKKLVDYEYLDACGGGERRKTYYRLKADEGIAAADFSMIPSPDAVERSMGDRRIG
jgi:energy-coupling factor transporter ATP-binding protein EcfA2